MSHYLSRLILASSLMLATPLAVFAPVAHAQFVPEFDLPSVPEHTAPVNIPPVEGNLAETASEADLRRLNDSGLPPQGSVITLDEFSNLDASGFEVPTEGGSETIAKVMKMLEPSVDTRIPETPTAAAQRINRLISAGRYDNALIEIAKLKRPAGNIANPTTDVQLIFLEARAYSGKGDRAKAIEIYRDMAYKYPELAEPWNNMAALQMQAGLAEQALESVKMALVIRPNYAIANHNIGLIYTQLANQSFSQARRQGVSAAADPARKTNDILHGR